MYLIVSFSQKSLMFSPLPVFLFPKGSEKMQTEIPVFSSTLLRKMQLFWMRILNIEDRVDFMSQSGEYFSDKGVKILRIYFLLLEDVSCISLLLFPLTVPVKKGFHKPRKPNQNK